MYNYSIIIPVFNRPDEIRELLESITKQDFNGNFEVVIVEDGSHKDFACDLVVQDFDDKLNIKYFYKKNTGAGDSRNFGMGKAKGDYFLILDSDVVLPSDYLKNVDDFLKDNPVDVFGGPDAAHDSFSDVQKSINYAMTSFLTTGGIRGGKKQVEKFQPRSFNMGISCSTFFKTGGFRDMYPGEDTDFSLRVMSLGYKTALIPDAKVYHKRRVDWDQFARQVYKFGTARPILNKMHKGSSKLAFWFPSFFFMYSIIAFGAFTTSLAFGSYLDSQFNFPIPPSVVLFSLIIFLLLYLFAIVIDSTIKNKSIKVGVMSAQATMIQFFNYGRGFLYSYTLIFGLGRTPQEAFPEYFNRVS